MSEVLGLVSQGGVENCQMDGLLAIEYLALGAMDSLLSWQTYNIDREK